MTASPILTQAALERAVKKALRLYHKDSKEGAPLVSLSLYQEARLMCRNDRQATNQVLANAVELLQKEHPAEANIIVSNHFDGLTMKEVAHKIGLGEAATYARKARGVAWLTEIIWDMEHGKKAKIKQQVDDVPLLPRAEEPVVGIERRVAELRELMTEAGPPFMFALVGMGGIGKTTLAQVLIRRLTQGGETAFTGTGWVSAKPANFAIAGSEIPLRPALTAEATVEMLHRQLIGAAANLPFSYAMALSELQTKLRSAPYVIVIDNLETVLDLETLLPLVRDLINPSMFVFTTRESLHGSLDVRHFSVPALDEAEATFLLRSHARNAGLRHLAELGDDDAHRVFEIVGGNPLALRLVVGQSHIHDLDRILHDLTNAKGKMGEFYDYVFRRAWDNLDEAARVAWLATPTLPATGGTNEQWFGASGLDVDDFNRALERLVTLNLVDARTSAKTARYSIHSLARTFLLNGIARWM